MSKSPSIWTNPLSIILIALAVIWIFTIVKYCGNAETPPTAENVEVPVSPISGYEPLPKTNCTLKLPEEDAAIASALLQQYFRTDTLNRFDEAVWIPNSELDPLFAELHTGSWETYVECIQTLSDNPSGKTEKLAIIASNFPENDCHACAPYIGYLRFSISENDPSTIVIRESERAVFTFGAYGAIGDQISLTNLGTEKALIFSTAQTGQGYTRGLTTLFDVETFQPILQLDTYDSNGGTDEEVLYEEKGDLYIQLNPGEQPRAGLALYQYRTLLGGPTSSAPEPEVYYYQYIPDSTRYIQVR